MDRRATAYLERSAQQPLTIVLRVWRSTDENFHMSPIWEILLSYSKRWKRADIDIEFPSMINDLVGHREKMPILESLAIVGRTYSPTQKYGTAFRIAPHLTELNLDMKAVLRRGMLEKWTFPWAQLTKRGLG
jgi:hypothetical protein